MIIGLFVVAAIILGKLFYIQIIDDEYKINSNNNSMVYDIIYPTRGIIYDRNGKIIVSNKVTYDILGHPARGETVRHAYAGGRPQRDTRIHP